MIASTGARLVAAGVADGPLALGVGPAGAVGDQLAVVADEQVADDLPERVELAVAWVASARRGCRARGRDCSGSPRRAGPAPVPGAARPRRRRRAARRRRGAAPAKYASSRAGVAVVVLELLVDEVDHERGVDDPDAGGEVLAAVVDEGVAAVAGAVADLAGDADLERPGPGARGERVELAVELARARSRGSPRSAAGRGSVRWARAWSICSAASSRAPSSIRTA